MCATCERPASTCARRRSQAGDPDVGSLVPVAGHVRPPEDAAATVTLSGDARIGGERTFGGTSLADFSLTGHSEARPLPGLRQIMLEPQEPTTFISPVLEGARHSSWETRTVHNYYVSCGTFHSLTCPTWRDSAGFLLSTPSLYVSERLHGQTNSK